MCVYLSVLQDKKKHLNWENFIYFKINIACDHFKHMHTRQTVIIRQKSLLIINININHASPNVIST